MTVMSIKIIKRDLDRSDESTAKKEKQSKLQDLFCVGNCATF